jgi:hypothetical protein
MQKAKKCPRCGVITLFDRCTCGGITKTVTGYNVRRKLSVDVTLTLRFDHDRQPFLLVQKPSGQARVALDGHDLLHL